MGEVAWNQRLATASTALLWYDLKKSRWPYGTECLKSDSVNDGLPFGGKSFEINKCMTDA